MSPWVQTAITVVISVFTCSGFWTFIQSRRERTDARSKMLLGLAHDRIIYLGMKYIERGWITNDEFENLNDYLYKPYKEMGGNGSAEHVMNEVKKLPIRGANYNGSQT